MRSPNTCGACGAEWYDAHTCPKQRGHDPTSALVERIIEQNATEYELGLTPDAFKVMDDLVSARNEVAALRQALEALCTAAEKVGATNDPAGLAAWQALRSATTAARAALEGGKEK